jgi:hypothetical protein
MYLTYFKSAVGFLHYLDFAFIKSEFSPQIWELYGYIGILFDFCWRSLRWRIQIQYQLKRLIPYFQPTQASMATLPVRDTTIKADYYQG